MKPRKREFKKNNKLRLAYIKDNKDFGNDIMAICPIDSRYKADTNLLFYVFTCIKVINGRTLIEELKDRGYDIETIYFEIEKKAGLE